MADPRTPTVEAYPDRGRDGFLVRTPFSEQFKADLKSHVPKESRRWAPELGKAWWVWERYRETIHRLLLEHFDGYEVVVPGTPALHYVDSDAAAGRQGGIL